MPWVVVVVVDGSRDCPGPSLEDEEGRAGNDAAVEALSACCSTSRTSNLSLLMNVDLNSILRQGRACTTIAR